MLKSKRVRVFIPPPVSWTPPPSACCGAGSCRCCDLWWSCCWCRPALGPASLPLWWDWGPNSQQQRAREIGQRTLVTYKSYTGVPIQSDTQGSLVFCYPGPGGDISRSTRSKYISWCTVCRFRNKSPCKKGIYIKTGKHKILSEHVSKKTCQYYDSIMCNHVHSLTQCYNTSRLQCYNYANRGEWKRIEVSRNALKINLERHSCGKASIRRGTGSKEILNTQLLTLHYIYLFLDSSLFLD